MSYHDIIAMMVTSDQSCWLAEGHTYYNLRLGYCILPLLYHHYSKYKIVAECEGLTQQQ